MKEKVRLVLLPSLIIGLIFSLTNCGGTSSSNGGGGSTQSQLSVAFIGGGSGTVISNPAGINCTSGCSANFNTGTMVTLTAAAAQGSVFAGWSGACTGTGTCVVTLNSNQSVTAKFTPVLSNKVTVTLAGTGSGTVTSNPAGISCAPTCTASFGAATQLALTATPNPGSTFAGWGGACTGTNSTCTVVVNSDLSVTATFTAVSQQFQLSVSLTGNGSGTVTSNPAGISCAPTCSANFAANSLVTLTPTPAQGSVFSGWGGACTGVGACNVTMNQNQSVIANFNPPGLTSINHIIFMLQENRSFDHYFGHLNDYRHDVFGLGTNDVDGYPYGQPNFYSNPSYDGTSTTQSFHLATQCVANSSPYWDAAHADYNRYHPTRDQALLDGFVFAAGKFSRDNGGVSNGWTDIDGLRAIGYYTDADLPYYYYMATQFATSDAWFSPILSNSQPNRMYLMAATSQGRVGAPGTQLTAKTIFQLLDEHNISWKIYVPDPPPGQDYLNDTYLNMFDYYNRPDVKAKIRLIDEYYTDLSNGTLPQVAFIEGGYFTNLDEHPDDDPNHPGSGVQKGSKYVSNIINTLMTSQYWTDSVFILSYDEFGGFFDHVPPMQATPPDNIPPQLIPGNTCYNNPPTGVCGFNYSGFRVPLIVVSPFTNPHFVSHIPRDYTAILKLIEMRFNLPSLTARDAAQADMLEFFNFANPPWETPPQPPPQPDTELCDDSHLQ